MTPPARVQAAIELLDQVILAAREEGPAADSLVQRYFKERRYAGAKDRRAVRELVFRAIRRSGELPASGRAAMLGLAQEDEAVAAAFDGSAHGPEPGQPGEEPAPPALLPKWIEPLLSPLVGRDEWPALIDRAPLDLRVNVARTSREAMLERFAGATPTVLSPWGIRLAAGTAAVDSAEFRDGLVEVQDEGSQLIALACGARPGETLVDLCAGAGGKALALAAASGGAARIVASDTNRDRLARLGPRAARGGATIETRLLDPGRELERLADLIGAADLVLVDAPCSGSGTWRRNPEGRWRLTPARLDRLVAAQQRLLAIAAELVRPGGRLVYAVCSLLGREGAGQVAGFLGSRSDWIGQDVAIAAGRNDGDGRLLTPARDSTDGFFIACLVRSC